MLKKKIDKWAGNRLKYKPTMISCIPGKQSKEKRLVLEDPLFLAKHITVFYYSILSIENTVICFVLLLSSNAAALRVT